MTDFFRKQMKKLKRSMQRLRRSSTLRKADWCSSKGLRSWMVVSVDRNGIFSGWRSWSTMRGKRSRWTCRRRSRAAICSMRWEKQLFRCWEFNQLKSQFRRDWRFWSIGMTMLPVWWMRLRPAWSPSQGTRPSTLASSSSYSHKVGS